MLEKHFHHNSNPSANFFTENRLAFLGGEKMSHESALPVEMEEQNKRDALVEKVDAQRAEAIESWKNVQALIDKFNASAVTPIEKPKYTDVAEVSYAIRKIIKRMKSASGDSLATLAEIKSAMASHRESIQGNDTDQQALLKTHARALIENEERFGKAREVQGKIEKTKFYQSAKKYYETVVERDEFASLRTDRFGKPDPYAKREHFNLLMSIMAENSGDFDPRKSVLGPDFTNNPETNKKKFPTLHELFMEETSKSYSAKIKVDQQIAHLKLQREGVTSIGEILVKNLDYLDIGGKPSRLAVIEAEKKIYLPSLSNKEQRTAYLELKSAIEVKVKNLKSTLNKPKLTPEEKEMVQTAINNLTKHANIISKLAGHHANLMDYERTNPKFKKDYLMQQSNRKILMVIMMKKFAKAAESVDNPFDDTSWRGTLNPAVRRNVIAIMFQQGVAGKSAPLDNLGEKVEDKFEYNEKGRKAQARKLVVMLSQARFFNSLSRGKYSSIEQRNISLAEHANALDASVALWNEEKKHIEHAMVLLKKNPGLTTDPANADKLQRLRKDLGVYAGLLHQSVTFDELKAERETIIKKQEAFQVFMEKVRKLINDPRNPKNQEIVNKFTEGNFRKYLILKTKNKTNMADILIGNQELMDRIDVKFNLLDLSVKRTRGKFEAYGMRLEGLEQAYKQYLEDNPKLAKELHYSNWPDIITRQDPEGMEKLITMFEKIIPRSTGEGYENFIGVLRGIQGKSFMEISSDPELLGATGIAGSLVKAMSKHLDDVHRIDEAERAGDLEKVARLRGKNWTEKADELLRMPIDLLTSDSLSEKLAGVFMIGASFKALQATIKGEGPLGKFGRAAALAFIVDVGLRHQTGEGLLDKTSLTKKAEAVKGSREAVQVAFAREHMKKENISEAAHIAALTELKDVPFDEVMDWYQRGCPQDQIPARVNKNLIFKQNKEWGKRQNRNLEVARILRETINRFTAYVGGKMHGNEEYGEQVLTEYWITALKDPKFDLNKAKSATRVPPLYVMAARKKGKVNFGYVMIAETDPDEAREIAEKESSLTEAFKKYETLKQWGAEEFADGTERLYDLVDIVGKEYKEPVRDFIVEMGGKIGTKLEQGEKEITLWYQNNEYRIAQLGDEGFELLVNSVRVPFELLIGGGEYLIPKLNAGIRKARELAAGQFEYLDKPLDKETILESTIPLGRYAEPFAKAFDKKNTLYVENSNEVMELERGVGYMTAVVTPKEAGVENGDNSRTAYFKMVNYALKLAKNKAMAEHKMTEAQIKDYLNVIHASGQSGTKEEGHYKSVNVFIRIPLPDSIEFKMKENDTWPNEMNARKYTEFAPWFKNPNKDVFGNLKDAFAVKSPTARKGLKYAGQGVGSIINALRTGMQGATEIIAFPVGLIGTKDHADWVRKTIGPVEKTDQWIDEWFSTAEAGYQRSDFYKKDAKKPPKGYKRGVTNGELYQDALNFAIYSGHSDIYLGHIEGRANKKSFSTPPGTMDQKEYLEALGKWIANGKPERRGEEKPAKKKKP